jgi:hypothetical protein
MVEIVVMATTVGTVVGGIITTTLVTIPIVVANRAIVTITATTTHAITKRKNVESGLVTTAITLIATKETAEIQLLLMARK